MTSVLAWVIIIKYRSLSGLNNQNLFSHNLKNRSLRSRLSGLVFDKDSL